jgi:branched-chain amino acid transport system substrate-binding protein
MKTRQLASCAAALGLAVLVAACGGSSSSSSGSGATASGSTASSVKGKPVNVLVITDTSGPTKPFGTQELLGLQAAARYYNAHGGILGGQVHLTVDNDNGDPTIAASEAVQALSSNPGKYAMVWAGQEGTTTAALIPIIKRFKVFSTAVNDGNNICANNTPACPYLFTMVGPSSLAEVADANYLKQQGITHVGLIVDQVTYDLAELAYMQKDLTKLGIKYNTVTFPSSAVSVTPEMAELKSDGVQAVFAEALGASAAYVLNARPALGWEIPTTLDITASSLDDSKLVPASELTGVKETIHWCMNLKNNIPAFSLMNQYAPSALEGSVTCDIAGSGWAGMVLLAQAAAKAGSLDPSALVNAAQGIKQTSSDPKYMYVNYAGACWTPQNHENVCNTPSDFTVVPVGTLVNTRLHPLSP